MNRFIHIKNFFHSLAHPYPARDWFVALIAVFFIFFTFAFYGVYLYFQIESGAIFNNKDNASAQPIHITRTDIGNVLDIYRARSANWNGHNLPAPPVTDPR